MLIYIKKGFYVLFKGQQFRFGGVQISNLFLSTLNTDWKSVTRATCHTMTDLLGLLVRQDFIVISIA